MDEGQLASRTGLSVLPDRTISLCGFVPYALQTTPSQRFRIEQWAPYLSAEGIDVQLVPFASESVMDCLRQPGRVLGKAVALINAFACSVIRSLSSRRCDIVLIHRAISIAGPAVQERLLAFLDCPMIYDFDDAVWLLHTSSNNRRFGWLKFPAKTATICRLSKHVIVGNCFLEDYARQYNDRVTVIPSSVETAQFRPIRKAKLGRRVVVGWTGSSTSQTHLEMFAPMLRQLCSRPDVELRVHSDRRPDLPDVPLVWRPWQPNTEVEELAAFDIGIMPMPDDPWARGKCAMKALLYMAMGIPAVCSAVGTNCEVIHHGQNGLLARTQDEWLDCLTTLIENADLRDQLGSAGRRTVEEHYSARRCAARFADVVREVVAGK